MVDQVIQRKFKGAGLQLLGEHHRQQQRVAMDGFVAGPCRNVGKLGAGIHHRRRAAGFLHRLNVKVTGTLR